MYFILRLISIIFLIFTASGKVSGSEEVQFLTTKEFGAGAILHTNGLGLTLQHGIHRTAEQFHFAELDLIKIRHPKETRSSGHFAEDSRPYVFGKLNSLYAARFAYGQNRILTRQYERRDVIVEFTYRGGITVGLLKPVYIRVYDSDGHFASTETVQFDPDKHAVENIQGGAPFSEGLNEISPRIGLGFKGGMAFRWDNHNNRYRRLEAGLQIDAFPTEIPIFATIKNKQVYLNLFIQYAFGRNW
jgi:hypothetical protein